MCESGRRYGSLAPAELARQCTLPEGEPTGEIDPSTSGTTRDETSVDPSAPQSSSSSSTSPVDPTTSDDESTSTTMVDAASSESSTSGPIEPTCAVSLADDFEDGVIGPEWGDSWVCDSCSIVESNGHVAFTVGAAAPMDWPSAGLSTPEGAISGGYVRAELVPFSPPLEAIGVWLTLYEETCELQIAAWESAVHVRSVDTELVGPDIATDEPMWLQIRVDTDGIAYWEWSADGMAWELVHSEPAPCNLDALRSAIFAGGVHENMLPITREIESYERCNPL